MFEGVRIVPSVITEREINIIYRYLAISANLGQLKGNKDAADAHMYYATPYFEALLSYYSDFMSDTVGEKVFPSYSFLWNYKKGYQLPKHKDRNSVDYIMSIGIHSSEESNWPVFVDGLAMNMSAGDVLILDGKRFEHWREACPYENRLQLILCYTRDPELCFDKRQHLGFPPVPEVITSPFQENLSVDDTYITELVTHHV